MPRMDGSGPMGRGPMTGRGRGFCSGTNRAGYSRGFGFRQGYNRSFARGYGRGFYSDSPDNMSGSISDREYLERKRRLLEEQLRATEDELDSL